MTKITLLILLVGGVPAAAAGGFYLRGRLIDGIDGNLATGRRRNLLFIPGP